MRGHTLSDRALDWQTAQALCPSVLIPSQCAQTATQPRVRPNSRQGYVKQFVFLNLWRTV